MKSRKFTEITAIDHDKLIGTRWISWSEFVGDRMTMEFVDKSNCIYTSKPRKYPMKYSVLGGQILFKEIEGTFVLRGNVLFSNDIPVFEKAA